MSETAGARAGFSLMEVLITVVILGIIAAIAVPNYRKTVNRGYRDQAENLLLAIYHGEQAYFYGENKYLCGLNSSSKLDAWRKIYVDDPHLGKASSYPIEFNVAAGSTGNCDTSFVAYAKRTTNTKKELTINDRRLWCGGSTDPDDCSAWPINDP